jgi:hypothetical protein
MIEDILSKVRQTDLEDFRTRVNESEQAYLNLFVNVSSETINEIIDRKLGQENMSFEIRGDPIDTAAGKATVVNSESPPLSSEEIEGRKATNDRSSEVVFKKFLDSIRG